MQLIYINALTRIYSYTDSKLAVAKQLNQDGHGNRGGDKCTQKRPRNGCGYPKSKKGKVQCIYGYANDHCVFK